MKKKALSLALALVMCLGLAVQTAAAQPAADQVYSAMIAMKDQYPEGTPWTNDNFYSWNGGIYSGGGGCAGFAFMLSDAAFGTLPARMLTSFSYDDIQVGDILRINNDTHSVIVLEVHSDHVVLAEGNYNRSIHWGRKLPMNTVLQADYLITRYPETASAVDFYITLDPNGGAVSPDRIKLDADGKLTASLPTPTRTGYQFEGWWLGEWNIDDNTSFTGPGTVTAKWTRVDAAEQEPIRIDFLPNGGTITQIFGQKVPALSAGQPPITIDDDTGIDQNSGIAWTYTDKDSQIAGLPTVERKGYTFDGWYVVSGVAANQAWDGALTDFSGCKKVTAVKFTESVELAAKWTKASDVCTVTFKINSLEPDLTDPAPFRVKAGGRIELPSDPKWEGYTFQGWYSGTVNNKTHVLENAVEWEDGDRVTEDVTIYALWQKKDEKPDTPAVQPEKPAIQVDNIPASGTALAGTQTVTVDGKAVEFQMYALKDANGNLTNYIKLRDMAYILNGSKAQFAVGYDGIISLTTGKAYAAGGTEMTTPYSGDRAYKGGAQTVKVDGEDVAMTAITLTDDSGGDYNYFKLRDLGKALGFYVGYSNETGVFIETDKPSA